MKARITIMLIALLVGFNFGFAQQDEECMNNLSIFNSYVKSKKYDDAYEPWTLVRNKCPKFNRAIYAYGDDILEHKIENSTGADQLAFIKDLMLLYDQAREHFPSKYPLGEVLNDKAELAYKYQKELNMSKEQIYNMFDEAYTKDKANFTSPKGLYTYFSLMVDLYDEGKKTAQQMFDKYDDVTEIIEDITNKYTVELNKLVEKEEAGQPLSKRDKQIKRRNTSTINAFENQIIPSMDKKLGDRANCEVLVPLYEKDFEENKENTVWLQRAMNRMYAKGCKEDPLFLKLVEQKNSIKPTADTAFYLYLLTDEQKYFDQTIELETDPIRKAKLFKKLADDQKAKGRYGSARRYYNEALKLNPSDGSPYLSIAAMYAKSANSCGSDNFSKRAVFWLAASTAERAGRVDGRLKKTAAQNAASYRASAPTKAEIFQKGNAGQPLNVGCWINITITVPKI
ncbi:tetratricopeptide repeat protein [Winogradskyella sp. DF17]|uniref:Tetratricopeptide repeat protein n=1 Tax=Winogradskyella pelagia TaxID=2819984 RepID=A0ABS3SYZ2_9FLAO|nr:tetratricopeptide repeat protein [Winogradskyella sp. DF17]MBO3115723.1 tetratricopeptide repeat protein [Winogradskyella sp. DF17]